MFRYLNKITFSLENEWLCTTYHQDPGITQYLTHYCIELADGTIQEEGGAMKEMMGGAREKMTVGGAMVKP